MGTIKRLCLRARIALIHDAVRNSAYLRPRPTLTSAATNFAICPSRKFNLNGINNFPEER
jgi:hypothetical protein